MGSFSLIHWLIFLVVVVVIFGTSRLKNAGNDLASAIKGFKEAIKEEDANNTTPSTVESRSFEATSFDAKQTRIAKNEEEEITMKDNV